MSEFAEAVKRDFDEFCKWEIERINWLLGEGK